MMVRRLRPSSLAATLAVFLALGGGAYAVTGSGTFQKENEIGIETDGELIRAIAGVGTLESDCTGGDPDLTFTNTSGEGLNMWVDTGDTLDVTDGIGNNVEVGVPVASDGDDYVQIHLFPGDGSKAPQADVAVSVRDPDDCATTQVAVLNLTTTSSGSGSVEGSGTVQKGSLEDLPSTPTTVRSIKGVGSVQASCNSGEPVVGVSNTSGETLRVFRDEANGFAPLEIANNASPFFPIDGDTGWRLHLFPANGSKTPQADVTVSVHDTDNCATSQVSVLNVTTQQ
jgi:hypothetical protein